LVSEKYHIKICLQKVIVVGITKSRLNNTTLNLKAFLESYYYGVQHIAISLMIVIPKQWYNRNKKFTTKISFSLERPGLIIDHMFTLKIKNCTIYVNNAVFRGAGGNVKNHVIGSLSISIFWLLTLLTVCSPNEH